MTLRTREEWREINEAFFEALALPPGARTTWLQQKSAGKAWLAAEVSSLLASHEGAEEFLEEPVVAKVFDFSSRPPELKLGEIVGDFKVIRTLGSGSFATVYLAEQISLQRLVAIKISGELGDEARNMAPLEHDNIVKVFSEANNAEAKLRFVCMQFVAGPSLDRVLKEIAKRDPARLSGATFLEIIDENRLGETALNPAALQGREELQRLNYVDACLWMTEQLADALDYAHAKGVLHLDVKPGNVLLNPYGRPLLMDFNVSFRKETAGVGASPVIGGTAKYMAPEQKSLFEPGASPATIGAIDQRADVYALGVVLKEMLEAGRVSAPGEIADILDGCLEPLRESRIASAAELVRHLGSCRERHALERDLPPPGWVTRLVQRNPITALLSLMLIPQVLGSFVNITYNMMKIVSTLTPAQQSAFHRMCIYYNAVSYPVCVLFLVRLVSRLPSFRLNESRARFSTEELRGWRSELLMLPDWLVFVCLLGWMPGSVLFPLFIHLQQGPVAPQVFGHFFISFSLSCLIAMTYSFLMSHFFVLRVVYPTLWVGCRDIAPTAREELKRTPPRARLFHTMAGVVPLAGATAVILVGPSGTGPTEYHSYRLLLISLIVMGAVGLGFALRSAALISQTVYAFTQRKH